MAFNEKWHGLVPTEEGYGRTDALARIANTVFGDHIEASNYAVGNAPVNYPPVWNIWKFDWVQYNASVSQPMARNIGESMGTGAKYALLDRYGNPLPPEQRFRSTALLENLHTIELTLRKLQPPAWNEDVLGPIDRAKAARGKELFNKHCVDCHGPFIAPPALKARNSPLKGPSDPEWIVKTLCTDDIGTDPNTALNFYDATRRSDEDRPDRRRTAAASRARSSTCGTPARRPRRSRPRSRACRRSPGTDARRSPRCEKQLQGLDATSRTQLSAIDPKSLSVGAGLSYLGMMIREKAYADRGYTPAQQADLRRLRHPRSAAGDRRLQAAAARRHVGDRAVPPQRVGADGVRPAVAGRRSSEDLPRRQPRVRPGEAGPQAARVGLLGLRHVD